MPDSPGDARRRLFYEAARAELVARIGYRDGALLAYVTAMGAYFALVIGRKGSLLFKPKVSGEAAAPPRSADLPEAGAAVGTWEVWQELVLLAPLPVISLAFTLVIIQHHVVIGVIQRYLVIDLYPLASPLSYDGSMTLLRKAGGIQWLRTLGQAGALVFPLFYAFVFHGWYFLVSDMQTEWLTAASISLLLLELAVLVAVAYLHAYGHRRRKESYTARKDLLDRLLKESAPPVRRAEPNAEAPVQGASLLPRSS